MINIIKPTLCAIALFTIFLSSMQVQANSGTVDLTGIPAFNFDNASTLFTSKSMATKRGEKYDETKDPALRKGTENTEQPQSSFFAIPAVVIGIIGLILFLSRDK